MSLEQLIADYGYIAIAVGTFFEGETVLVLGGFAAHRSYLELPWVIVCAFCGSLLGDQLYYYIGRYKGKQALMKRPHWQAKSQRVLDLLDKHQVLLILGFRFLYGLRSVTPFLIGASSVKPTRFLLFNIIGAAIWACVVGVLGYLFGNTIEVILGDIKHYELQAFGAIALVGMLAWLYRHRIRRRKASQSEASAATRDRHQP
ncbi:MULTISPECIES: DedA family protein [Vibrio]|uniref:DedA family protein n=1 Tax=Vibrio ostreae TaxID=2841925 RepID=A0A975YPE0_9VIBR|nr:MULTISPECIES: DedA family protein [Vibrio]QXO18693.1 DedA family protein [Vibrio ostreae]